MRRSHDDDLPRQQKTENQITKSLTEQLVTAHGNYKRRMEQQRTPKDAVHPYSINVVHKHHPDVKLAPINIQLEKEASEKSSQSSARTEDSETVLKLDHVVQYHTRNHPRKRRNKNPSYISSFVPEIVSHRSIEEWEEKFNSRLKYKHESDKSDVPKAKWDFNNQVLLSPLPKPVLVT